MTRKTYLIVNVIFIILISGVFIYCYSLNSWSEHITCIHHQYLGVDCPSCGLTRSFTAMLHHDSQTAFEWNKYGSRLFLFFEVQLILRAVFMTIMLLLTSFFKILLKVDWILSAVLFLGCFYPFILSTFYMFYRMVVTGNMNP